MNTISFRASIFTAPDAPLSVQTVELPAQPGSGDVLVRMRASGVCHSDFHVRVGEWSAPIPMILGHEGSGVVEAVGDGVTTVQPGDHVVLSWTPSCGRCQYCISGRPVLCDKFNETTAQHVSFDGRTRVLLPDGTNVSSFVALGTYGEFAMVPEPAAIKVRADIPFAEASLIGCAVTTGIGAAVNTAGIRAGNSVLVIGAGGVGLNAVQGARLTDARMIIAADLSDEKLAVAKTFGATHTINSGRDDLVETVRSLTEGRGVEYALEAIGLKKTIELAYQSIARGGTAVVVGQAPEGVTIELDPFEMSDQEKTIKGSNYGSSRPAIDFPRIADLQMDGQVDLSTLVTSRIGLDDIEDAFAAMKRGEGIRAVIEYPS